MISKIAVLPTMILSVSIAVAAERSAVIVDRDAFACTSWGAWHDYTLASLTPMKPTSGTIRRPLKPSII
jgi:hypothetical protein